MRAFNVALACPPLAADGQNWRGVPAFARIGDRGNPLTFRNDVGVMEFYGTGVITVDPYDTFKSQEPGASSQNAFPTSDF